MASPKSCIVKSGPRSVLYAATVIRDYMTDRNQFAKANEFISIYHPKIALVEVATVHWYQHRDLTVVPIVASGFFQQFPENLVYRIGTIFRLMTLRFYCPTLAAGKGELYVSELLGAAPIVVHAHAVV